MVNDPLFGRTRYADCDECGKRGVEIKRVYRDMAYCAACYQRVFKRGLCHECGNYARLPAFDEKAVCRSCEQCRPCVRCRRVGRPIGRMTPQGPACSTCAKYFVPEECCESCGRASYFVAWVQRQEERQRLCPRCARSGHQTCQACRRYRSLQRTDDGRMLCAACATKGDIPCPSCGKPMPAGRGDRCEGCYWRDLLSKRVKMNRAVFDREEVADQYGAFARWLQARVGVHKAAITVNRYVTFFHDVERAWGAVPPYVELVERFGAQALRRAELPMRWLAETGQIIVDEDAREADSERRRIRQSLNTVADDRDAKRLLHAYHAHLMQRLEQGRTSPRSVRLALRPAATLLCMASERNTMPPDQPAIRAYLQRSPGQRAALTGFINYLRKHHGLDVHVPKAGDLPRRKRRKRLEDELARLLQNDAYRGAPGRRFLTVALQYFHDLPAKVAKSAATQGEIRTRSKDSICVVFDGQEYLLPRILQSKGAL